MTKDHTIEPLWKQRFRTPSIAFAKLAAANPSRGVVTSNISGISQLYAWDTVTNSLHQITHEPTGKLFGAISPNGKFIYYLKDEMGNELGHFVRVPFKGGDPEDITPDLPLYAAHSIALSHNGRKSIFIKATPDGFDLCLIDMDEVQRITGVHTIYHSKKMLSNPVISDTGQYVAFQSTERSGTLQFNAVILDTQTGDVVHDLWDSEDSSLQVCDFSSCGTYKKLLGSTNESGQTRPFILDIETGSRIDLEFPDFEGDLEALSWSPNGRRLLLCQIKEAEQRLYTYTIEDRSLIPFSQPSGSFPMFGAGPQFVSEDEIYSSWQDSTKPSQVIALDGWTGEFKQVVLNVSEAPSSKSWKSVSFPSSDQMPIQAWMATPEGEGPFPAIVDIHGGPSGVTLDHYMPSAQAWLDHGFAFISINYHGSTTFGREFQDKIIGNLGHWEIEDIEATYHWLVKQGVADPKKIFVSGWSYGGYLTLLSLGRLPDYWAGGMAGIAIADWNLMYEDQAETLKGYQVALFGGTPEEKTEEHRISSPITYVEDIQAPIL
ncbi:MAG: S9 family peptidase, partial [Anaerolineaceae bacterium]|nr:S9 family peptidase [Anaerolineaceae bacterium]